MGCKEFEVLLSAYANDELTPVETESVERHLADCSDCRATLKDFREVRQQVSSLKSASLTVDIKDAAMARIKNIKVISPDRRWLRRSLVAVPVALIMVVLVVLQPWTFRLNPENVIAKAQAAIASVQSYRISMQSTNSNAENTEIQVEFSAPDRLHYSYSGSAGTYEYIILGDDRYYKGSYIPLDAMNAQARGYSFMLSKEATSQFLDYLTDVRKLRNETIDGTICLHYRGIYDIEKQLRSMWEGNSERGIPPLSEEEIQERLQEMLEESGTTTIELWIGKDDYLIRQMKHNNQRPDNNGGMESSTADFILYDFNESVIIDPPLDSQGNLLSDWNSTISAYPHFNADIQVEIDNYDPSNRQVNYTIIVTNITTETVNEVDVKIQRIFPAVGQDPDSKIWFTWDNSQNYQGPYNLTPDKSLKYTCTFGYDATSISPEIITETVRNSYVEVTYVTNEGEKKTEIFHFEAPGQIFTLSTDVPPQLIPIEFTVAGEYRIEEPGATYTGNGTAGMINGRDYLFVEINTNRNNTEVSPGILILDIQNKARPRKVAFLNTNDDTVYISGTTLYGTVLYASIDDSVWIIDVSNPAKPKELARLSGFNTRQMIISGKYAFVNDGNHDIVTLDLSDPLNPRRVGALPSSSSSSIQLDKYGDYLIAEVNDTLQIIDASSPASLAIVSQYSFHAPIDETDPGIIYPYHIMGTEIQGDYAYVNLSAEGSLAIGILDLSDPANPREESFFRLKDRSHGGSLFVSGDRLYIFTRKSLPTDRRNRLEIIDISNPTKPVEKGFIIMLDAWSFFEKSYSSTHQTFNFINNYLYWFIGNEPNLPVIEIIDLSGL